MKKLRVAEILSLTAIILTLIDLNFSEFLVDICGTDACREVQSSAPLLPYIGLAYFCCVVLVSRFRSYGALSDVLSALLISGVAVEAILVMYQWRVLKQFCPFCLVIAVLVFAAAATELPGALRVIGLYAFVACSSVFFFLSFTTSSVLDFQLLKSGRAAVSVQESSTSATLLFSESCSHCQSVLKQVQNSKVTIALNPVSEMSESFVIPQGFKTLSPETEATRKVYEALGSPGLPLLIVEEKSKVTLIFGETKITEYFQENQKATSSLLEKFQAPTKLFERSDSCEEAIQSSNCS